MEHTNKLSTGFTELAVTQRWKKCTLENLAGFFFSLFKDTFTAQITNKHLYKPCFSIITTFYMLTAL